MSVGTNIVDHALNVPKSWLLCVRHGQNQIYAVLPHPKNIMLPTTCHRTRPASQNCTDTQTHTCSNIVATIRAPPSSPHGQCSGRPARRPAEQRTRPPTERGASNCRCAPASRFRPDGKGPCSGGRAVVGRTVCLATSLFRWTFRGVLEVCAGGAAQMYCSDGMPQTRLPK